MSETNNNIQRAVSLVVLAAGMGRRFGGDKQLAEIGPARLPLMYYNLLDAYAAGIRHAVLVLRESLLAAIESELLPRLPADLKLEYTLQTTDDLPAGCQPGPRDKPWGTGHALWCARDKVSTPFIAVNADDYYGEGAIELLVRHFQHADEWALACYTLGSTLSPHGGVNRGLCHLRDGYLAGIEECLQIHRQQDTVLGKVADSWRELDSEMPVSMNLWGFTPEIFTQLEQGLREFLAGAATGPNSEFFLPGQVLASISTGAARVAAYLSRGQWLGITYPEDLALADAALQARGAPE